MKRYLLAALAAIILTSAAGLSSAGATTQGRDSLVVTTRFVPDAGTKTPPSTDVTSYDLGPHNEKTGLPVHGLTYLKHAQTNTTIRRNDHQSEAGCGAITITVQDVSTYLLVHETHWEYHMTTHQCWHWRSYHRVDYPGCTMSCRPITAYGWWDHVESLIWRPVGQCNTITDGTGATSTCVHNPFYYEGGYYHSGQQVIQRVEVDGCVVPGCSVHIAWHAKAELHMHDDGTWKTFATVEDAS